MVVDELARLVAFPTVSNRPVTALASHMAERAEALGFRVERFDSPVDEGKTNIVASIGPQGTDGLVLSGHMDVVPTEGQPWTSDPFAVTERDGKLYGRGTADMKGFLAATMEALARIPASAYTRELVLVWTHDEEVGCVGSAHLAHTLEEQGRRLPSNCLIGEPTDFQVLRMHPGHVGVGIDVRGAAAHSSRPDLGINAIAGAARVVDALQDLARELESETSLEEHLDRPWVAFNVATIRGGSAINIVPDHCRIELGYRPLPGMRAEEVYERVSERVRALSLGDAEASTDLIRVTPSLLTEDGTALAGLLAPHATPCARPAASFATDGGNLARAGSAPLIFGPGSITVAHQADEWIATADLIRAVDVIEDVVRRACCQP
ncbi:MAG: acetylornithine deacetylase [Deltaproteobacteria bacterium]|nr:MAG: acetylornithine deacetylase [Deltaproteobacteria bacterium]